MTRRGRIRRLAIAAASASSLATAAAAVPGAGERTRGGLVRGGDENGGLPPRRRGLYNYYTNLDGRKPRLFQSGGLRNANGDSDSSSSHVVIDVNVNINDNTKYGDYYWATSCPDDAHHGWGGPAYDVEAEVATAAHQRQQPRPAGGTHWQHQEPILQHRQQPARQQGYGYGYNGHPPAYPPQQTGYYQTGYQAGYQTGYHQTGYQTGGYQNQWPYAPPQGQAHGAVPYARTSGGGGDQRRRQAKSKSSKKHKASKAWHQPVIEWGRWSAKSTKESKGEWDDSWWGGDDGGPSRGWNMVKCPLYPTGPTGPPTTARPNTPGKFREGMENGGIDVGYR